MATAAASTAHGVDHGQRRSTTPRPSPTPTRRTRTRRCTVSVAGRAGQRHRSWTATPLSAVSWCDRPDARHARAERRTARSSTRRRPNFIGPDSFTYTVSDSGGGIERRAPCRLRSPRRTTCRPRPPTRTTTNEDTPLTVSAPGVLANDTDVDGDALSAVAGEPALTRHADGCNADGAFTYTPAANFFGTDAFTYTVNEAGGASSPATVSIAVASTNDAADRHRGRVRDERGHAADRRRARRAGQRHRRGRRSAERGPGDRPGARHPRAAAGWRVPLHAGRGLLRRRRLHLHGER